MVDTPKGILVVSESGRGYLLPGGNARKGESRRKAAIRELEEETGLKATDASYLFEIKGGIHKNRRGDSVRTSHKVFLVKTIGVAKPQGEIRYLAYVDGSNSLKLSRSTRRIIERYNKIKNLMLSKNGKKMKTAKKEVNSSSKCYVCVGLKSIFRKIKRSLTFWDQIDSPPSWVQKAHYRWERKYYERKNRHPREMWVQYVGKNHIYRAEYVTMETPGPATLSWYKKRRIK